MSFGFIFVEGMQAGFAHCESAVCLGQGRRAMSHMILADNWAIPPSAVAAAAAKILLMTSALIPLSFSGQTLYRDIRALNC